MTVAAAYVEVEVEVVVEVEARPGGVGRQDVIARFCCPVTDV